MRCQLTTENGRDSPASPLASPMKGGVVAPDRPSTSRGVPYAWVFLVAALVAAAVGFGGVAGFAMEAARLLFWVFILLFVISLSAICLLWQEAYRAGDRAHRSVVLKLRWAGEEAGQDGSS
jgi:uncharacterized membrane protein YtjA (UPF0391 family)